MFTRVTPKSPWSERILLLTKVPLQVAGVKVAVNQLLGGPGETGTDQEVSRRHKTRDKHVRVDVVVVSFSKLGLEGHQSTGIPVFRYFVSIGGRQVDFVVCFFGAVRFGFIQTVVEFQTIVPEVFRLL